MLDRKDKTKVAKLRFCAQQEISAKLLYLVTAVFDRIDKVDNRQPELSFGQTSLKTSCVNLAFFFDFVDISLSIDELNLA